jgi:hypothetical protein
MVAISDPFFGKNVKNNTIMVISKNQNIFKNIKILKYGSKNDDYGNMRQTFFINAKVFQSRL